MRKADLLDRLNAALDLLDETAKYKRLPKAMKEEITGFTEEARKVPEKGATLYRVAKVLNQKTGREVTVQVKTDGTQTPRFSHLPDAKEWTEVRATGWADATARVRAGEGKVVKAPSRRTSKAKKGGKKAKAAK
jgi:hypothetical protein